MTFPEYQFLEAMNLPRKVPTFGPKVMKVDTKYIEVETIEDDPDFCLCTLTAEGEMGIHEWRRLLK